MFKRFIPKEGKFFELFQESAELSVKAAYKFQEMLSDFKNIEEHSNSIKDLEHKADMVTHQAIELLHKTFITPLDRDDIHTLIKEMDNIIDFIDAASQRMFLYDIRETTPQLDQLAEVCVKSAECVKKAVTNLKDLKYSEEIKKNCMEINRLENEADQILRKAIAQLFREETDIKKLIKLKEIYELLEVVSDHCEDVANIIEGIALEYS